MVRLIRKRSGRNFSSRVRQNSPKKIVSGFCLQKDRYDIEILAPLPYNLASMTARFLTLSRYFLIAALTLGLLDIVRVLSAGAVALAVAAILFGQGRKNRLCLYAGWTVTTIMAAIGLISAIHFFVPAPEWLASGWVEDLFARRLMPLPGALCLMFLSLALAAEPRRKVFKNGFPHSFSFLIPVLMLCLLSLVSSLFELSEVAEVSQFVRMSWLDLVVVLALSAHILTAPPLRWPVNVLASSYTSLRLSRYYLLVSAVQPIILGLLVLYAYDNNILGLRSGLILFVFATVVISWIIVISGAAWAHRLNQARDLAVRRLEESWKGREAYFRCLVDESPVILYLSDKNGNCTFLSRKWQEYTGRPAIQDLALGWLASVHPEDRERIHDTTVKKKLEKYEPFTNEYRLRRWDGQYRWVISSSIPRFDDARGFLGYMGTVIDVHDHKLHEDSLLKGKREAELSNQTKSQFLANMSHEIRTPLNAILGFADLCGDMGCSREERIDFLKRIRWNGDHLLRLIDDILDLAKMESGSQAAQKTEFSIGKIMEETVGSLRALASQKGLSLELRRSLTIPPTVFSDPLRVKQIVTNLVGNAIKFTASGGVKVSVDCNSDGVVVVEISDSGIGLSLDQQKNLFKPFSQADSSVTRKYGGTGLGLHLSKKLAQSIGGDVVLKHSEVGLGSTFVFSFKPEKPPQQAESAAKLPVPTAHHRKLYGKKILVAEDSPDSRELIHLYFRSTGAQVLTAENGMEAMAIAWRERPDVILMDVQMPGMDGLEATRRLRAEGFNRPIVALTAHALQDEVDRSFEAGCNYHLTKPVMKDVLLSLVGELLQHAPPAHHI